jgi:hypothetical protein
MEELTAQVEQLRHELHHVKQLLANDLKSPKINLGQIQTESNRKKDFVEELSEVEFQVFSQFGDDGIIQYLVNKLDIPNKTFIEFGVENYTESNTRFLLFNNNWTGYVIDGSASNVEYIRNDLLNWTSEIYAESAFITAENINELLAKPSFDPEVGILSIDIDGNDYWVWKQIDQVRPVIVIIEYNSLFGKNTTWTVPYDPSFVREEKHPSLLYFGASLKALTILSEEKGYSFIGSNGKGNNAYFIRNDKVGNLKVKTAEEGYVVSKFREAVLNGVRVAGKDRLKLIEGLDVLDTRTGNIVQISSSLIQY